MKKFILSAVIVFAVGMSASAQTKESNVTRKGNTFSFASTSRKSAVKDTLVTKFTWADANGTTYPIIINRGTGRCYIFKVSKKTGKYYKYYMKEEVSRAVCKELGVTYVEKD